MSQKIIERDIGNGIENFIILTTECEFNGSRQYLIRERTGKRVRLFSNDEEGIDKSIERIKADSSFRIEIKA